MTTPVRLPTSERREQIADAALAIIGRQGFSALTTTALAEEIGVTSGALFRHFPSRDAILEETVRRAEARLSATLDYVEPEPLPRLERLARARVQVLSEEPGLAWLLRSEEAFLVLPPAAVETLRDLVKRSRAFIEAALRQAIAQGDVRDDLPPDVLLFTFTAAVHAMIRAPGLQGRAGKRRDVGRLLDGLFAMLAPPGRPPRS